MEPRIGFDSATPTSASASPSKGQEKKFAELNKKMTELAHTQGILEEYLKAHPQRSASDIPEHIKSILEKHFRESDGSVSPGPDMVHYVLEDIRRQLQECHRIYPKIYHQAKTPHEPALQPRPDPSAPQNPLEMPEILTSIMVHLDPYDRESVSLVNREWFVANSIAFKNREIESAENLIDHIMNFLKSHHAGAYSPILDRLSALRDRITPDLQAAEKQQAEACHEQGSPMAAVNQVFERLGGDISLVLQSLGPDIRRSLSAAWGEKEMPYAFGSDFLTRTDFLHRSSYPALPSQEEVEKAFTDAQTIPMTQMPERLVALGEVSKKWLLRGEFRKAFDVALLAYRTSPNEPFRETPLRQVFEKIALFGGIERALTFLNEIKAELDPLDLNSIRNGILMNFRPTTDQEMECAYSLAKEIPQRDHAGLMVRKVPMKRLVSLAMQKGNYAQAQKIAEDEGSHVLQFFVGAIARKGDYAQAEALVGSLHAYDQDKARLKLAMTMAQRGDYQEAQSVIGSIDSRFSQNAACVQVATAMAQRGDYQEAQSVIGSIDSRFSQNAACEQVATAMAQRGDYQEAQSVIGSIDDRFKQNYAYIQVATALAQRGDYTLAENPIGAIADRFSQNLALEKVVSTMAQRGDYEKALTLIKSIPNENAHDDARAKVAIAMVQRGDDSQAEALIRAITNKEIEDQAHTEMAIAMVQRGDYSQAKHLIGSLDDDRRESAFEKVAHAMAQRGDYPQAEHLIRNMVKLQEDARSGMTSVMEKRGDRGIAEKVWPKK